MLCFGFSTILSLAAAVVVATTSPFQGSTLVPASQFAGHNNTQSLIAAQDALHGLLDR